MRHASLLAAALVAMAFPAAARVDASCTGRLVAERPEVERVMGASGMRQLQYAVTVRNIGTGTVVADVGFARTLHGVRLPVRVTLGRSQERRVVLGAEAWRGFTPDPSSVLADARVSCLSGGGGRMLF